MITTADVNTLGRIPLRLCDAQWFWGLLCVVMKSKQNVVELTFHAVGFRFVEPYIVLCLTGVDTSTHSSREGMQLQYLEVADAYHDGHSMARLHNVCNLCLHPLQQFWHKHCLQLPLPPPIMHTCQTLSESNFSRFCLSRFQHDQRVLCVCLGMKRNAGNQINLSLNRVVEVACFRESSIHLICYIL